MKLYIMVPVCLALLCNRAAAQSGKGNSVPAKRLDRDTIRLNDVVVTGQYAPQSLKNSVYQVRTITSQRIQQRGATSVLGVLNNELGIRFSNDAVLGETDVELMGMSGTSVKILLDGVPLVDRGSTRQSLSQIDINTIERIEIVEGPMSVVYGTDALAGVINIITKKNGAGDHLSVTARIQEETVGREYKAFSGKGTHNESLGLNWGRKGWFAGGGFTRNNFGGWQGTLTGRQPSWRPKDQLLANGSLGYGNDRFKAWYRLDYLNEDIISKGDINFDNGRATDQHYFTERYTHQAQASWQVSSRLSVNGVASLQDYRRRTRTTIKDFTAGTETLSRDAGAQDVSRFNTWFFRGTVQYSISPLVAVQPGIEYKRDGSSGQRIEGRPVINDYSFFASAEIKPWAGVNIRPGIRLNKNSVYDAPPLIPSINTKFALTKDLDLRLAYARGFRAPALRELYFYFFDASHAIIGNTHLKAEYSNSVIGSLSWQALHTSVLRISATLAGFYNHFDNRIDIGYLSANADTSTYINISKFRTTGGTLSGTIDWKNLQAGIGFSAVGRYNKFADDTAYNKEYPTSRFVWTPEVNANLTYLFKRIGGSVSVSYKYNGTRPVYELATIANKEAVHLAKTSAFHYADVTVAKQLLQYVTVQAGIHNLFDVTSLRNSTLNAGQAHSDSNVLPMWYGRSYFLGLTFNWTKH